MTVCPHCGGEHERPDLVAALDVLMAAAPDASVGLVMLSPELKPTALAGPGDLALRALGEGSTQAAAGDDARFPTPGQKNALAGTAGTPGESNPFVTTQDPRNSDTRPPTPHTHPASDITGLPAGGAEFTRVKKTADTPNSTTTLSTDPHLTFALLALTDYEFAFDVVFTTAATSTGLVLALTGPASPALFAANIRVPISKTAAVEVVNTRAYDDPALGTGVDAANPGDPREQRLIGGSAVVLKTSASVRQQAISRCASRSEIRQRRPVEGDMRRRR
jgi:hypothetical protein